VTLDGFRSASASLGKELGVIDKAELVREDYLKANECHLTSVLV